MSSAFPPHVPSILAQLDREDARAAPPAQAMPAGRGTLVATARAVVEATRQARESVDALAEAIEDIAGRLSAQIDHALPPAEEEEPVMPPPLAAVPAAAPPAPPAPEPPSPEATAALARQELARMVALELAHGGATRAEIAERLETQLGATDTGPLLDSVLGTTQGAHVPTA